MKKVLLGVGALAIAVVLSPLFAAFEAHVINVTAKIENALGVSTNSIDFGTVFPQEHLAKPLAISLSKSFMDEGRVDAVSYFIRQKPKCGVTNEDGTQLFGPTWTGHVYAGTATDPQAPGITQFDGYWVDCAMEMPPLQLDNGAQANLLPSLCEYISKHPVESTNDGLGLDSFHKPFWVENGSIFWNDTPGLLSKSQQNITDNWLIDLAVPCFGNHCAQDWEDFVHRINPNALPANQWIQPIENEHKIFGCNLWVEVNGVVELPTIGANLLGYEAPEICNATVSGGESIQTAINNASNEAVICVGNGTYNETLLVNKPLTLSALEGPNNTATITGGVRIASSDVVVEGFVVNPGSILGETAGFYLDSGIENVRISSNIIDGNGVTASRGVLSVSAGVYDNVVIENNVIRELVTGIYLNPVSSGSLTVRYNNIHDNSAGIGGFNGALVSRNVFTHTAFGSEAIGIDGSYDGNPTIITENNFLNGSRINDYGAVALISAPNNFFGPDGGVNQTTSGQVDFTPESAVPFPQN